VGARKLLSTIFAAFSFIFVLFLLSVVVYETVITEELPTDKPNELAIIGEKYSFLSNAFAEDEELSSLDEDEEFEDEEDKHEKGFYNED
jgi:hypothetical protein